MKNLYFLSFFLVLFYSCTIKKDKSDYIIEINVEKNYEEKIIYLQDIANVKYVPLKTNEGYITTSRPRIIRDNFILLYDLNTDRKDFLRQLVNDDQYYDILKKMIKVQQG